MCVGRHSVPTSAVSQAPQRLTGGKGEVGQDKDPEGSTSRIRGGGRDLTCCCWLAEQGEGIHHPPGWHRADARAWRLQRQVRWGAGCTCTSSQGRWQSRGEPFNCAPAASISKDSGVGLSALIGRDREEGIWHGPLGTGQTKMTLKCQDGSHSTASALAPPPDRAGQQLRPWSRWAPRRPWPWALENSPEAAEYAQGEIWHLETKAPEGKGQSFKQKVFPFPWQC